MKAPRTSVRLIEPDDAEAVAAHLGRDAEAFECPRSAIPRQLPPTAGGKPAWSGYAITDAGWPL